MPQQYIITETIISPEGVDRAGIKVQAFDLDLPSLECRIDSAPQIVGEATMDTGCAFKP
jgi:hypothetical protein